MPLALFNFASFTACWTSNIEIGSSNICSFVFSITLRVMTGLLELDVLFYVYNWLKDVSHLLKTSSKSFDIDPFSVIPLSESSSYTLCQLFQLFSKTRWGYIVLLLINLLAFYTSIPFLLFALAYQNFFFVQYIDVSVEI